MQRCLTLAEKGLGTVSPNPMVGALLVYEGKIISEGFTSPYGGPHAEVNAISKVEDKTVLINCTLYVSLEPCAHYGKTPPCANLIVNSKIPRVVIGAFDTFSEVNGKGIEHLQKNGVEVITSVLEKECRELNHRFFTFHEKKRPYVILKWAQTKDGFMDKNRYSTDKKINWITGPETKSLVHLWRSQEMGILVGRKTIQHDNPKLDVRLINGNNPTRIVIDPELKLDLKSWSHAQSFKTLILNKSKSEIKGKVVFVRLANLNTESILKELHQRNILSLIVEGGKNTLESFINSNLWDEARILTGEGTFGDGLESPKIEGSVIRESKIGKDQLTILKNL